MVRVTRRHVISAIASSAVSLRAVAALPQGSAPVPSSTKGPIVYLDYDQAELDAAYDQGVWAPNANQVRRGSR